MKGNTDLFEKENRMYHRGIIIHIMFETVTDVVMIGK